MNNQQNNQEQPNTRLSSLDRHIQRYYSDPLSVAGPCTYKRKPGHPAPPPTEQDIREILRERKAQLRRRNRNRATVLVVIGLTITAYALWRLL